jgi:hypothetical protein
VCCCQVPRVALTEMGPQLDCVLRRCRLPPVDLEKEALRQPKLTKKKVRAGGVLGSGQGMSTVASRWSARSMCDSPLWLCCLVLARPVTASGVC